MQAAWVRHPRAGLSEASRRRLHRSNPDHASRRPNLDLLSTVLESPGWAHGLPSWVPDFSGSTRKWSPSTLPHTYISKRQNPQVSGQTQSQYHFEPDGRGLRVKGHRLSTICAVGQPWIVDSSTNVLGDARAQTGQYAAGLIDCIKSWFDVVRGHPDCLHDGVALEIMVRVLAQESATPYATESLESLVQHLSVLVSISGSSDRSLSTMLADPQDNPGGFLQLGNSTISAEMQRSILHIYDLVWKNVFRTAHNFLGTGTHSAKVGDVVVVLHGCSTAAILRPWTGGFKYISPAHVHGIMNGEFWNSRSAADDEWFVLI